MNLNRVNIVLGVLLAISAGFAIAMKVDYTQPNVEFLSAMRHSPAFHAFSTNPVLPDGRTLQPPVPGAISRSDLPLYYAATKEDAVRAGEELQNPFAVDESANVPVATADTAPVADSNAVTAAATAPIAADSQSAAPPQPPVDPRAKLNASIQRGAQVYNIFCVSCHGSAGAGDGPVTKRGFPPPPPLTTGKSVQMQDGQLFHILTYGQGSMSSMAAQLDRNRRWDVINFVRSLQQSAALPAPASPTTEPNAVGEPLAAPQSSEPVSSNAPNAEQPKTTEQPKATEQIDGSKQ